MMISFKDTNKVVVPDTINELLSGSWHDRMTPKAIVLSYLTARTMGIVRFPTRPDRVVDGFGSGYFEAALMLDQANDQELASLCTELTNAYNATQTVLLQKCPTGFVTLQRAVALLKEKSGAYVSANRPSDPIEQFALLAVAAKLAKVGHISLDFDIVSGWSQSSISRYGSVNIRRAWPISDVLLISDLTVGNNGFQRMESDEWLCINRNPRGMLSIAYSDFDVEELPPSYLEKLKKRGPQAAVELQKELTAQPTKRKLPPRPSTNPFGEIEPIPKQSWWSRCVKSARG